MEVIVASLIVAFSLLFATAILAVEFAATTIVIAVAIVGGAKDVPG